MVVNDIVELLERLAPASYQESYDNSGLLVGIPDMKVTGISVALDVTPEVVEEAVRMGANLIVAHHPVIFKGLKRITGSSYVERTVMLAIKYDVAIYAFHTNFDSVPHGVNSAIASRIGLVNTSILQPIQNQLYKLVTFVPESHAEQVRTALFSNGAGNIGNYDSCSYNLQGEGTFRALQGTNPYVGEQGKRHTEKEVRIETVVPKVSLNRVIASLIEAHPYEEVAYDVYALHRPRLQVGLGMVGYLESPVEVVDFLKMLKKKFRASCIRYTNPHKPLISKVALCGGSGDSLLEAAIGSGADIFISADFKYHRFFDADNRIIIADIGHFESEQFTIDLIYEYLSKKISKFAVQKSNVTTNPINYL